jgi:hypothetical protein
MITSDKTDAVCGYERTDATFAPIAKFAGALLALVVVVGFAMKFLFGVLDPTDNDARKAPHPLAAQSAPPAPNLQAEPPADLAAYEARQADILSTYGWVDPAAHVVRIPIERAMDLVAERGLPVHK